MRLLVAEDDTVIADALVRALRAAGHAVDHAPDGGTADTALATTPYDLLVLDLGLPQRDGLDVLARLRARGATLPVLILTARDALRDRVIGLDTGADDYLVKPFDLPEFEARVRALLRRGRDAQSRRIVLGRLHVDLEGRSAWIDGERLALSAREFGVLELLLRRRGRVVSKDALLEALTGWDEAVGTNAIEVYVHRLRRKVEAAGVAIRTLRGLGYLIEAGTTAAADAAIAHPPADDADA
ncbi:MAG: response regulator [Burkholderiales bacterium]|jgi:DNA-binding response OmpR family regulator|nr:response regulator [Burkholderiales bacterium]